LGPTRVANSDNHSGIRFAGAVRLGAVAETGLAPGQ